MAAYLAPRLFGPPRLSEKRLILLQNQASRCSGLFAAVLAGIALIAAAPAGAALIPYTGAVTTYVVPETGIYLVTATGGSGGSKLSGGSISRPGGAGAVVSGQFAFTAGQELTLLVGGAGGSDTLGGGGGGSFVIFANTPDFAVIAGGGGGAGMSGNGGASTGVGGTGAGGSGGAGASDPSVVGASGGGGGGGLRFNGGNGGSGNAIAGFTSPFAGGEGGSSYLNGGAGGDTDPSFPERGGFGGGGGGGHLGLGGGGGGGGYNGGNGGDAIYGDFPAALGGAGGTSYSMGAFASYSVAPTLGDGSVSITLIPEPASLILSITGGLALLTRRRRSASAA